MSNYPPGVSGNEPQISGNWPCECFDPRPHPECRLCNGTGRMRDDVIELTEVENIVRNALKHAFGEQFRVGFEYDGDGYMLIAVDYQWLEGTDWAIEP